MKMMIINASPRRDRNTAYLLHAVEDGAMAAGAETEYIDLYDFEPSGCHSCLVCKRKDAERCKCYWPDDISFLIDQILASDKLVLGSPIYFSEPTAGYRALFERLAFCCLSYDGGEPYFKGKVDLGFVYTMNGPQSYYETALRPGLSTTENILAGLLNGTVRVLPSFDTLQVDDYSLYAMGRFDEEHKKKVHEEQFPEDLAAAFELGKQMATDL